MSKRRVTEQTSPGVEALLLRLLEGQARIEARLDQLSQPSTEAHDHRFLVPVVEYCGLATFTGGEVFRAKSEAIQSLMWTAGDTPNAITALFKRCCGHRIGNVRLTRVVGRSEGGIRWRWEPC